MVSKCANVHEASLATKPDPARHLPVCRFQKIVRKPALWLLLLLTASASIGQTGEGSATQHPDVLSNGKAAVTQDAAGSLTLSPQNSCVTPAGAQQFTAFLRNISGSGVNWYVDGVKNGNGATGTISADGLYAAPSWAGAHTVQAVSQAYRGASARTMIEVTNVPVLAIFPNTATAPVSGHQAFKAQNCGIPSASVTWAVDNVPGGNATVGTINGEGIYAAPPTVGTHKIQATDTTTNKTSEAVVNVRSAITVDFGSRTNKAHPIRAGILGVNHVDWLPTASDEGLIAHAGITLSRTYANIPTVYATTTPNWKKIDPQISELQAEGFHVLLQLSYTPTWLQLSPNPCGAGNTQTAPASATKWAQLAKSIVAHMDSTFPGVVTDYEIWNEPDSGGMCGVSNKLNTYLAIYAAAAPLMKKQAAADGKNIRVGGPTTSYMSRAWTQALLSNASTAPYVDFVSYHDYVGGTANVAANWDFYNGYTPLYQLTQNSSSGPAAIYTLAAQLVAAGKQPLRGATPIYVDEFNTNWTFQKECCRNDPTFAPVWNALYVSDLLDTVYSGTSHVPGQLTYYSANTHPYFCMVGDWDSQMDCSLSSTAAPVPYPQYYAYELMASPQYLGINSGGYMAASVSPAAGGAGLVATAFYTSKQDSILIVNPTGSTYSETVSAYNLGISSPVAYLYEVVQGRSISRATLALTKTGTAYNATISVPPYTVLGIAIK
jgi:hypothetical protein